MGKATHATDSNLDGRPLKGRRTDRLREQPLRQRILGVLDRSPGASISEVGRLAQAKWGTLQYHLNILERAGLVKTRRFGREAHVFPTRTDDRKVRGIALLRRQRVLDFVSAIVAEPGLIQQEITARTSISRKILRQYVGLLEEEDLLIEVRAKKFRRYYPTPRLVALMAEFVDEPDIEREVTHRTV